MQVESINRQKTRNGLSKTWKVLVGLCVGFAVLFPKGGFVIADIPITWGYILIAIAGVFSVIIAPLKKASISNEAKLCFLALLPFFIYTIFCFYLFGIYDRARAISHLLNIAVFPTIFLWGFAAQLSTESRRGYFLSVFKWCVFLAAVYGIVLFIYFYLTRRTFELPFITVNGSQEDSIYQKDNARGAFMKLVATYNNGNIYGVCTLMLLPIYQVIENSKIRVWIVKLALVLTLSRTIWVGLIVYEFLYSVLVAQKSWQFILKITFVGLLVAVAGAEILALMHRDIDWLINPTMSGRTDELVYLQTPSLFPYIRYQTAGEILYSAITYQFGYIGLPLFLLAFFSPLWVAMLAWKSIRKDKIRVAAVVGIATYFVTAFGDAAFTLIPTGAMYWLTAMIAMTSLKSRAPIVRRVHPQISRV